MRTSLSSILSLILISVGEMMSLCKYFQYLDQSLFNRAFNKTSIKRRSNWWIFARLLAVIYSSLIFWTIACFLVHVTGAAHDRGHQAGDGVEMDDGSGQGGDRALEPGLQLADGTGHCRPLQASHWPEAHHGGLWLAGEARGWCQLRSATDLPVTASRQAAIL